MDKYTIEGNFDFYSELYKSLDENPKEGEGECGDMCLITNMPLEAFFVTLGCNHKFNYMPLFNEIQNQKLKINTLSTTHLQNNQVMCPYCRCSNNSVLPFHEELGVSKIYGINTLDITYKLPNQCLDGGKDCLLGVCEYKTTNQNNEIISCNNKWVYKIKQDPKCYCYTHKLLILTKILAEKKLKEKEAKLAAKLAAKAEVKAQKDAAKELAKLAAKAQKDAVKAASKAQKDAAKNAPSSSNSKKPNPKHQSTTLEICTEILKSGKNAGTQCPCKALLNGKCGRHTKPQISATNAGENIIISSNPPAAST
jgi:hypothetical protein